MAPAALAALVVLAVLVETPRAPYPRCGRGSASQSRPDGVCPERVSSAGVARGRVPPWFRRRSGGLVPARSRRAPDVAALMTEVAARLRVGAAVHEAWRAAIERARSGGDDTLRLESHGATLVPTLPVGGPRRRSAALAAQVAAMRAATRLADRVGAPLADVLERCADGVAAAGRAESARRVALAGPASTARLLSGLPVVGLALGAALGADPMSAVLDGGIGTGAALGGLVLLALGHRWTAVLVAQARDAGGARPGS